jgi:hypothetical protein
MNRLDDPFAADEVVTPPAGELGAWIYSRNTKNAAANGRIAQAA